MIQYLVLSQYGKYTFWENGILIFFVAARVCIKKFHDALTRVCQIAWLVYLRDPALCVLMYSAYFPT